MTSQSVKASPRPREVTVAGVQIVAGSVLVLFLAFNGMAQLRSTEMRDVLTDLLESEQAAGLNLTIESARELVRYTIFVSGGLAAVALILGVFVLRRDRPSRLVLTAMGGLIAVVTVLGGPPAWILTAYVVVSVLLLWTKAARAWFAPNQSGAGTAGPAPPDAGWTPPSGGPPDGPHGGPPELGPPPPPPPPRR